MAEVTSSPLTDDAIHAERLRKLREITPLPTAAGREGRVFAWVNAWLAAREGLVATSDEHGNVEVRLREPGPGAPVYFTAHTDHPAFVVAAVDAPDRVRLEFRGGVMDDYFVDARVAAHHADAAGEGWPVLGTLTGKLSPDEGDDKPVFPVYGCTLDAPAELVVGDVVTWSLPEPELAPDEFGGVFHTHACDDLAALAAAVSAMDELLGMQAAGRAVGDARLLLTRAEEIGFVGAIGACKSGLIPKDARLIALENSRSFADSPIHGGPIVRVGDRISVFSPTLTAAVADVAQRIAGHSAHPVASEKAKPKAASWRWQRKLMAGGACEASVFCAFGYDATCVCLPLGNYHNMADLASVQAGTNEAPPRVGREFIGVDDYHGMVDLLVACGHDLGDVPAFAERVEKLWAERAYVLSES